MSVQALLTPLTFPCGKTMKNRFMLAPLTNTQSHPDGVLSTEEHNWLAMRARGGFGMTMTAAAHVQPSGQAFPGQLGVFDDRQIPNLKRLADAIRASGSLSIVQLHHGGTAALPDLIGHAPVGPSDDEATGSRALTTEEVGQLAIDFAAAAVRCERAGFDGVELHGAHSYILCRFLSPTLNTRTDQYGGSLENRARVVFDTLRLIRQRCKRGFVVGIRISPERFGMDMADQLEVTRMLVNSGLVDFIDFSLWDCFKEPETPAFAGKSLIEHFMAIPRGKVRYTVAGKIFSAATAARCLEAGADFVALGRAAILHHDFPQKVAADPDFTMVETPVTPAYLANEGLSPGFVKYMRRWKGFVTEPEAVEAAATAEAK